MNPYRTVDRFLAVERDIRRHLGLRAFSFAMWLCPEIRSELQAMHVALAQSHAARRYQKLLADHQLTVARMARRN